MAKYLKKGRNVARNPAKRRSIAHSMQTRVPAMEAAGARRAADNNLSLVLVLDLLLLRICQLVRKLLQVLFAHCFLPLEVEKQDRLNPAAFFLPCRELRVCKPWRKCSPVLGH